MKTLKTLRGIIWLILVVGWVIAILAAVIQDWGNLAIAFCILAVMNWIAAGMLFSRYFGIRRHARRHLRCHPLHATELIYPARGEEHTDIRRALEALLNEQHPHATRLGISYAYAINLLQTLRNNVEVETLKFESHEIAPSQWEDLPTNAIYFLTVEQKPCVVSLVQDQGQEIYDHEGEVSGHRGSSGQATLQIVAVEQETCRVARDLILEKAREVSAYRGKSLIVRSGGRGERVVVEYTTLQPVDRARIVLPDSIFQAVERTVLQQMRLAEQLLKSGQRTRTAILLYGPPGTGKTLLTRHLITQSEGYTTLVLQGFQRAQVRKAFRLARYLEPALIILEDVDLIALRRQRNRRGMSGLHALLDELDGLAPESRCAVIMTTNRPDVLEPALASRPGRVTQAIEFPMPTESERQQLLALFLKEVDATSVDRANWASRTDGASPAFLEELVRRAVLIALHADPDVEIVNVTDDHLQLAMQEIVSLGGRLTKQLLGHL